MPATIAVVDGQVRVGLDGVSLERLVGDPGVVKTSIRDLGPVLARGSVASLVGATTVAATSYVAGLVGIRVFATGGLGGVHRGADRTWDESADLLALAGTPTTVVCAGVKSILDVPATLERLETLSVPVIGYRTDFFPGFYVREAGLGRAVAGGDAGEVAAVMRARDALGLRQGLVVAQPVPADVEMDRDQHDAVLASGLAAADEAGVTGKDVTPFLLEWFHERTGGASLRANVALVMANARLAGRDRGKIRRNRHRFLTCRAGCGRLQWSSVGPRQPRVPT